MSEINYVFLPVQPPAADPREDVDDYIFYMESEWQVSDR